MRMINASIAGICNPKMSLPTTIPRHNEKGLSARPVIDE